MTTLTQDEHDKAVRHIATHRFPFPDQPNPSWPLDYRTYTNTTTHKRVPIEGPSGPHWPDIVIKDSTGRIREIGEVEVDLSDPKLVERWKAASLAADDTTDNGCRHLLVYVPAGSEPEAQAILEENGISYHALRGIRVDDDGSVHVLPFQTIGNTKDHRADTPPPVADDPVRTEVDASAREAVIRFLLAERFPFPTEGLEKWPVEFHALSNTRLHQRMSVPFEGREVWPDIVVVDGSDSILKIGTVETEVSEEHVPRWRHLSRTVTLEEHYKDPDTGRVAKHFLVYVPLGHETEARDILGRAGISCAGVRGYEVTVSGRVRLPAILPPVVRDAASET